MAEFHERTVVTEWSRLQHQKTKKLLKGGKKTVKGNWVVKVSNAMWESIWQAWDARNKALHGIDYQSRYAAKNKLLQREAKWLRSRVADHRPDLINESLDDLLSRNNYQLHCWIKNWTPVMDNLDSLLEAVHVTDSDEDLESNG